MSLSANKKGLIEISALFVFLIKNKLIQIFYKNPAIGFSICFVFSLLIFNTSCKEKEKVGLNTLPNTPVGVNFTDTISFTTKAVLVNDTIRTSGQDYIFAGAYHDPEFGNITTEGYSQLLQQTENLNVSGYLGVDSVIMNLNYLYYYGDTTQGQTINVYELSEDLSTTEVIYSTGPAKSVGQQIDSGLAIQFRPYSQKQRVVMKQGFGKEVLDFIGSGKDNATFTSNFKGVALTPKDPDQGAVVRLNLASNLNYIRIYFKQSSGDTSSVYLMMNTSGARYSRILGDRSGTPNLSGLTGSVKEIDAQERVFVQSGIGIRTKMFFPSVSNWRAKLGNISINRAELIIQYDSNVAKTFYPIGTLFLVKLGSDGNAKTYDPGNGNLIEWPVQDEGYDVHGVLYPVQTTYSNGQYTINISNYFQALVYGTEDNYGLMIASYPTSNLASVNRVAAGPGYAKTSVKFRIYYTVLK